MNASTSVISWRSRYFCIVSEAQEIISNKKRERAFCRFSSVNTFSCLQEAGMDKLVIGGIVFLVVIVALILYCCVCVGSKADKQMEEMQRIRGMDKVNGKG